MNFIKVFILVLSFSFLLACNANKNVSDSTEHKSYNTIDSKSKQNAIASAENWLELIDSEKYNESWDELAIVFKNVVSKQQWVSKIKSVRTKFGNQISREMISDTYTNTLPGAPDGEYVVIQFKSKFEKKEKAIETITPTKESDGVWRVSGYYIK